MLDFDETVISTRQAVRDGSTLATSARERAASVVVISHPDPSMLGRHFAIADHDLTIGRSAEAEISFPGMREVSRRHARIFRQGDGVLIEDLGSRNGTFLRGEMLRRPSPLTHGDQITIESIHLRFISGSNIEHAYHEAIYDLAMRDDLTQIFNRRKYDSEVERDFARSIRHKRQLALIVFDVDRFKDINDRCGHLFGDAVLQQIAALVSRSLRKEEVFARAGGDEFIILCPEVGAAGAAVLAERLRKQISAHEYQRGEICMNVSCSFGVAERTPEMTTPDELYAAADANLYAAKSAGRNTVNASASAS